MCKDEDQIPNPQSSCVIKCKAVANSNKIPAPEKLQHTSRISITATHATDRILFSTVPWCYCSCWEYSGGVIILHWYSQCLGFRHHTTFSTFWYLGLPLHARLTWFLQFLSISKGGWSVQKVLYIQKSSRSCRLCPVLSEDTLTSNRCWESPLGRNQCFQFCCTVGTS